MPRRNFNALLVLGIISLACALRADRHGQTLIYALNQISARSLDEVDRDSLFQGAMEGMVGRLDDHSAYITPEQVPQFRQTLDQRFGGVGIQVSVDPQTGYLTVLSPLVGSPAQKAGILAGDQILRVDGESTEGMSIPECVDRIQGKPGTPVVLTVLHAGADKPVDIEVVRAVIRVDTVLGDVRLPDGSWDFFLEGHEGIGYLRINTFAEDTGTEIRQALAGLQEAGMRGLILDLRNDPGGLLGAAIEVADLFIREGIIVTTRNRHGDIRQAFAASGTGPYTDFPMVVLVNQYSASASEIVAACLQDHGRAVVVGQRTYGKGTVQEIIELGPGRGTLKLTTASYWRPSGRNIHRVLDADEDDDWGVSPDEGFDVPLDNEELARLSLWRNRRDMYRVLGDAPANDDDDLPPPDAPVAEVDRALARAIEYLEAATKERP